MLSNVKDGPVLAFGLAAVGLVGIVVTICTGHPVPTELWGLEIAAVSGGLGITNPTGGGSSSTATATSEAQAIDQAGGAVGP